MFCVGTLFNGDKQINDSIPTVSENLLTSGAINQSTLFLYFPPSSADDLDRAVGEVGWGLCIYHFKPWTNSKKIY